MQSSGVFLSLSVDRNCKVPLFTQIYEQIKTSIAEGRIADGTALPPSRSFALELGVSRMTVTIAYEQLIADGYAEGRRGSAIFAKQGFRAAATYDLIKSPDDEPPRSLDLGTPDMRLFPGKMWTRYITESTKKGFEQFTTSAPFFGDPVLRAEIARHLYEWRNLKVTPEQVIVTAGSGEALGISLRTLTAPGDLIGIENPGYPALMGFVQKLALRPLHLQVGGTGAELPHPDSESPRVIVLTPSHQFPLGGPLPVARRQAFVELVNRTNGWIVEDDFDSDYVYEGVQAPAIASLPGAERVIYIGTFSKSFYAGLRLGYAVVPRGLVANFSEGLAMVGARSSSILQRSLANMMQDGELHKHMRRMRAVYGRRRAHLVQVLKADFEGMLEINEHPAGMQVAAFLPDGTPDQKIATVASEAGISCKALSSYYGSVKKRPGLVLGFCMLTEEEMRERLTVLKEIVGHHLPPSRRAKASSVSPKKAP